MSRTILIVDDDRELCDLVGELLRGEGFDVDAHHSGAGAVDLAASGRYELVILDVMLPEQNGFEILRALRRRSAVPVILLTARGEDVDRSVGLEIGADDYLPKPFNSRELTARIHAVLRRMQPREQDTLPRLIEISLDATSTHGRIIVRDHGPGLGLSIAAWAARVHGGSIRAVNAAGGGLEVTITVPLYKALHSSAVS